MASNALLLDFFESGKAAHDYEETTKQLLLA
jgi:hypothetical protein